MPGNFSVRRGSSTISARLACGIGIIFMPRRYGASCRAVYCVCPSASQRYIHKDVYTIAAFVVFLGYTKYARVVIFFKIRERSCRSVECWIIANGQFACKVRPSYATHRAFMVVSTSVSPTFRTIEEPVHSKMFFFVCSRFTTRPAFRPHCFRSPATGMFGQ